MAFLTFEGDFEITSITNMSSLVEGRIYGIIHLIGTFFFEAMTLGQMALVLSSSYTKRTCDSDGQLQLPIRIRRK